jgi:hypothetical protein
MKRIAIIFALAVVGFALASAEVVRTTSSITTSTNNVTAIGDTYGVLRRAVVTVNGGTSTVSVVDSDGTAILSTNGLTGAWTWTGEVYTARSVITTTNSAWSVSNAAATVTILFTVEQ